jgi:predicted transcriptional regulator
MTYSEASKYSKLFEAISNPYILQIFSYLNSNEGLISSEILAVEIDMTVSKVEMFCKEMEDVSLVRKEYDNEIYSYEISNSDESNIVKKLL